MPDEQHATRPARRGDQLIALSDGFGKRLLAQNMLPRLEGGQRKAIVSCRRRRNDDSVNVIRRNHLFGVRRRSDVSHALPHDIERGGRTVAGNDELAVRKLAEDAHVVRAPVAETDESDTDHDRDPRSTTLMTKLG